MTKNRLEAFSDGVLAIIITIMILDLKVPQDAHIAALRPLVPSLLSYVLSFVYVGIYWNNHHHMLHATQRVNGTILWANLHLLFWLSLVPFATDWIGKSHFASAPLAVYGMVLLMAALAYTLLQQAIIVEHGRNSLLAGAVGSDIKGKLSLLSYVVAVPCAFLSPWIAGGLFVMVAVMWLLPDRRIETNLKQQGNLKEPE